MAVVPPSLSWCRTGRRAAAALLISAVGFIALLARRPAAGTGPSVWDEVRWSDTTNISSAAAPPGSIAEELTAWMADMTRVMDSEQEQPCECGPDCRCARAAQARCTARRSSDVRAGHRCAEAEDRASTGDQQRVISYSLFQTDGRPNADPDTDQHGWGWLLQGVEENARLSERLYPGWRIRVYHDTPPGTARRVRLAAAACRHPHVDLCYVEPTDTQSKGVYRGALWRFLPLADPRVEAFVSRDLDSRLSARETAAVQEWLASNSTFHIMRDHWDHLITVPGGLWGARPGRRRELADKLSAQLEKWLAHPGRKNWDQRALHSVVWFHAAVDSVQHDSYTCQRFPGYTVPFPTRRDPADTTQYLGQVVRPPGTGTRGTGTAGERERLHPCPPQCRPRKHQDWEFC